MPRARPYLRVSTQDQAEEGFSLPAQRERIDAFCRAQGWAVDRWYVDDGKSARNLDRPALQQLLLDLQRGDVVVVYRLDRLTRSVLDLYTLLQRFAAVGAAFRSVTEVYDTTTAMGRLFMTLVAALAQWERENLAERVRLGMAEAARQGKWMGGPRPFGYLVVDGALVPHPEEAPIYRELVRRYLCGAGTRRLAHWLRSLAITTEKGHHWNEAAVSYMLRNPVYAGKIAWARRTGRGSRRGSSDPILAQGSHLPLIPPDQWQTLQEALHRRRRLPPRTAGSCYPLSGLARCRLCGRSIGGTTVRKRTARTDAVRVYRQYRCRGRTEGTCPLPRFRCEELEQAVVAALAETADRTLLSAAAEAALRQCQLDEDPRAVRERLEQELTDLRRQRERMDQDYRQGLLTASAHSRLLAPVEERIQLLQAKVEDLDRQGRRRFPLEPAALAALAGSIAGTWDAATPAERRELLRTVLATVWVNARGEVDLVPVDGGARD